MLEINREALAHDDVRSVKKASSVKDFILKHPNLKHLRSASDNSKVVESSLPLCSTPVRNRLTAWKAKSLSIGGRLTLLKSVLGSIPIYFLSLFKAPLKVIKYIESLCSRFFWGFKDDHRGISWVKWDSILASPEFGGLGVGSLLAKNLALLGKWKWRFISEKDALWRKVICNFYGGDGGFSSSPTSLSGHGVWCDIVKVISNIERIDFSFKNSFNLKVSNGLSTSFWKDAWWPDGSRLMDAFPRLFALESFQDCKVSDRWVLSNGSWIGNWAWRIPLRGRATDDLASLLSRLNNFSLSLGEDKWVWNGDASGKFKVCNLSASIQVKLLADCHLGQHHTWNRLIPRKVNICVWRASLNRLPTRPNLVLRRISLDSVLCPFCDSVEETLDHCLISCPLVSSVWCKIWAWWGLDRPVSFPSFSIADISLGAIGLPNHHFLSKILHGVFQCALWAIWKWRNKVVNAPVTSLTDVKVEDIFPSIQRLSMLWIAARCKRLSLNWNYWISSPLFGSFLVRSVKAASSVKDFVLKPPNVKHLRSGSNVTKVVEPSSPLCSTPYDLSMRFQLRSVKKASSVKDFVLNPPNLNLAPLRNKNVIVSEKLISKPLKKDLKTSFDSIPVPGHLTQVSISARTWSDSNSSWDSVSSTIRELGKEAICRRNHGFSSAVHALEETSAMENILKSMSVFAEICELAESSKKPLVEQFLNFYQKHETSAAVVNTLIDSKSTVDKTKVHPSNSALSAQTALGTNLAKFTLLMMEEKTHVQHSEGKYHVLLDKASEKVQLENRLPENKRSPKTQESVTPRVRRAVPIPKKESPKRVEWSKGSGLKDTANLADKLLLTSRKWFLNYLEVSLNKGFGLTKGEDSGVAVSLLGQLKRVTKWLDDSVRGEENVENLRKKLYRFLLDHVQKAAK
ncbi:RNA-directed DNA polymerase, eukaryota, reverse transcriptase zinc-binding domain protein [Tanacetum coccineum]